MKGLDLRRLKKISSDENVTTFKHDLGHEIKVVHSKLSSQMQSELARLPVHMAEGGQVTKPKEPEKNDKAMSDGGHVNNVVSPDNTYNHYIKEKGVVGGTVYDGSDEEKFLFGDYCFDIDRAREIARGQSNSSVPVDQRWIDKTKIIPDKAMESTSTNPVFIAQIHTPNGLKPLLIDGNHRMYKAMRHGTLTIPAYVFSPEQTTSLFTSKPKNVTHPGRKGEKTEEFSEPKPAQKYMEHIQKFAKGGVVKKMADGGDSSDDNDIQDLINPQTSSYAQPTEQQASGEQAAASQQNTQNQQLQNLTNYYSQFQGLGSGNPGDRASSALDQINQYQNDPESFSNFSSSHIQDLMNIANPAGSPAAQSPSTDQAGQGATESAPEAAIDQLEQKSAQAPDQQAAAQPSAQQTVPVVTPQQSYANNQQKLQAESANVQADINNGHIAPHTYADLYNNKNILGKIGMIFGLLVGSAGAGLSHQSNALLGMMNQELDRDLDAQKNSNVNAQNWYRLSQQQELLGAQKQLIQAQSGTQKALAQQAYQNARVNGEAATYANMRNAMFSHLLNVTNNMPPGPQKQTAGQVLGQVIAPAIQQQISQKQHQTSTQVANQAQSFPGSNLIDMQKVQNLQMEASLGLPNIDPSSVNAMTQEVGKIQQVEQARQNYNQGFDQISNMLLKGGLEKGKRDAVISQIAQDISFANPSMSAEAAKARLEAAYPRTRDDLIPGTVAVKRAAGNSLFNEAEANTPYLDRYGARMRGEQTGQPEAPAMVRAISPTGQAVRIPSQNVQAAIKRGYKVQ